MRFLLILATAFSCCAAQYLPHLRAAFKLTSTGECGTDDLLMTWHCEGTNISEGVPTGCTLGYPSFSILNGGGTAGFTNNCYDGSFATYSYTQNDGFEVPATNILNYSNGTVVLYCRFPGGVLPQPNFVDLKNLAEANSIFFQIRPGGEVRFWHVGAGNYRFAQTSGAAISTNTWYKITGKWRMSSSPYLSIKVDDGSEGTTGTLPVAWTNHLQSTAFFGSRNGNGAVQIDYVRIWGIWRDDM